MGRRGTFISLEGVDGSGKSTQARRLAAALGRAGAEVVSLREPGGTRVSERVRALLLDPESAPMAPEAELLLYEASRAQLVREAIEPALARGAVVVCDRFADSTYAYQAWGRGIDEDLVRSANELGTCGVAPDATLVLDLDPELALARATRGSADRLEREGVELQRRVRSGYLALAEAEPSRVRVVDAEGGEGLVWSRVVAALADVLPQLGGGEPDA